METLNNSRFRRKTPANHAFSRGIRNYSVYPQCIHIYYKTVSRQFQETVCKKFCHSGSLPLSLFLNRFLYSLGDTPTDARKTFEK